MFTRSEPWQEQFFPETDPDIVIPTDDVRAYSFYPAYQWVHNKLLLAQVQELPAAPLGILPESYPVIIKPIYNLYGMSVRARKVENFDVYPGGGLKKYEPGLFWMPYLEGQHYSIDVAIVDGNIEWVAFAEGVKDDNDSFLYWKIHAGIPSVDVFLYVQEWVKKYLPAFCGVINMELIGTVIIDHHLRLSPQFVDLYDDGWTDYVTTLYRDRVWNGSMHPSRDSYSVVLRTTKPGCYKVEDYEALLDEPSISSIQITFRSGEDIAEEDNDEFSYRLALVNGFDLDVCAQTAERLRELIITL